MQESHLGVDLTSYNVNKLVPDPIYSNYKKQHLHFPIGAIQKGLKPHTEKGIKRIMKKNYKKKQRIQADKKYVRPLNPKSPEQIVMKSLRTQFRQAIEENHMQVQSTKVSKKQKWAKRKASQKQRRNQLKKLVKGNKIKLIQIFGQRINGYGGIPKISRKQIKQALGLGLPLTTTQMQPETANLPKKNKKIKKIQVI